jgi:hypothetical protein
MAVLVLPGWAVKMIAPKPGHRLSASAHFQNPARMNKTICGIIIADGRGWKMRNAPRGRARRALWQRIELASVSNSQLCATCLGALRVGKRQLTNPDDLPMFGAQP